MQQGPNKEIAKERLYEMARFFGKAKDDLKLNQLIDIYYQRLDTMPMPNLRKDNTNYVLDWMKEMEIDDVINESKWWTRNSLFVAEASLHGWTKNEWKNLVEYIVNG
jgi:hypothetical protein